MRMPLTPHSRVVEYDVLPHGLLFFAVHCADQRHSSFVIEVADKGFNGQSLNDMSADEEDRFMGWWAMHQDCENTDRLIMPEWSLTMHPVFGMELWAAL